MCTSNTIDYSKFYTFRDPLASRPLRLESAEDEWLTLHLVWELAKGRVRLDRPLQMRAYQGGQATDVLQSGLVAIICVSSRVIQLLREHGITGWSTYPVDVYDRQRDFLPGYHGLAVTGPECRLDRSRSQIITKPPPVPGGLEHQAYKGLYFDESQWDGSDMFWVQSVGRVVTEKVYKLFRKDKISNVEFTPLSEAERAVSLDKYDK